MKRISDLIKAREKVRKFLEKNQWFALTDNMLFKIFEAERESWNVKQSRTKEEFLFFLLDEGILEKKEFSDKDGNKKLIYTRESSDSFTIFSALKTNSYYSHYSAMFMHGLTLQIPKTYYLNFEHTSKFVFTDLTQDAIDNAFSKEQRKTENYYSFQGNRIYIINGKNTGYLGVIESSGKGIHFGYTDLERTLIDIAIRPAYSGGVFEVLEAYNKAKPNLNPDKLSAYLKQLKYIYPYHQVIGFYLENAGYSERDVRLFEKKNKYKFYLTYNIRNKSFSERWNLYYPEGM